MAIHEDCARQIVAVVHANPSGGWCATLERIMSLCLEVGVDVNDPKWNEPSGEDLAAEEPVVEKANGEEVESPVVVRKEVVTEPAGDDGFQEFESA